MSHFRGTRCLLDMLAVTGRYVATAPFDDPALKAQPYYGPRKAQRWARELLKTLDVKVELDGFAADVPAMYVANHRSYVDILAVLSVAPVRFVAKAEILRWPVLGAATALGGSIFIDRADRSDRARARAVIAAALRDGKSVCVFPEGTTHATGLGEFGRGAFEVAVDAAVPVVPVAIEYADPSHAWVGEDDFVSHFRRTFGGGPVALRMNVGAPIRERSADCARAAALAFIERSLGQSVTTNESFRNAA